LCILSMVLKKNFSLAASSNVFVWIRVCSSHSFMNERCFIDPSFIYLSVCHFSYSVGSLHDNGSLLWWEERLLLEHIIVQQWLRTTLVQEWPERVRPFCLVYGM
jgi:hypothetical protein